jgi:hypothetical protein
MTSPGDWDVIAGGAGGIGANESSFAKTIQLFINPNSGWSEMRLQNG